MDYVGLDVHVKYITVCVLNGEAKVDRRRMIRQLDQLVRFLEGLNDSFQVCYEAGAGYGQLFERLSRLSDHAAVAHPGLLKLIFRSKKNNGRNDLQI